MCFLLLHNKNDLWFLLEGVGELEKFGMIETVHNLDLSAPADLILCPDRLDELRRPIESRRLLSAAVHVAKATPEIIHIMLTFCPY